MTVLVTRSAPGSDKTLKLLRARGIDAVASPVLVIEETLPPEPDWRGVQALLVTSAAGAKGGAHFSGGKSIPALAVGAETARALREGGFSTVISADGDADALAALALAWFRPDAGKVVHVRGAVVAADLAAILAKAGFATDSVVVYRAEEAASLSDAAQDGLRSGAIDMVLAHSQAGAAAFVRLAAAAGLSQCLQNTTAIALSARTAAALDPAAWREIRIAPAPNEEALLALIA
ncbi:MAG: uroporphyrinogen-III synthase [Caulobacterales bacterium]